MKAVVVLSGHWIVAEETVSVFVPPEVKAFAVPAFSLLLPETVNVPLLSRVIACEPVPL